MTTSYIFADDDLHISREITIQASSEKEAHKATWAMLTEEEKNACGCWTCVDEYVGRPPVKNIAQLVVGDIVWNHGGQFKVTVAPRSSISHRPQSAHLTVAPGPSNCAVVESVCVGGEVPGYFKPGTPWTLQGTVGGLFAVSYQLVR
jgi:hypothetical protein